jgi:ribosomal protein L7/L12
MISGDNAGSSSGKSHELEPLPMAQTDGRGERGRDAVPSPPTTGCAGALLVYGLFIAVKLAIIGNVRPVSAVFWWLALIGSFLAWDIWRIQRAVLTVPQAWAARLARRRQLVAARADRRAARQLAAESAAALPWLADRSLWPGGQPGVLITPPLDAPFLAAPGGYDVVLEDGGLTKIQLIKQVRMLTRMSLKESKDLVDGAPAGILRVPEKPMADAARAMLEGAGGTVSIRPAGELLRSD